MPRETLTMTSIKDGRVVLARSLSSSSGRKAEHRCLLEGITQITWALSEGVVPEFVLHSPTSSSEPLLIRCRSEGIPVIVVSEGVMRKIGHPSRPSPAVAVVPLGGIVAEQWDLIDEVALVLDDVKDHGNIGTCVRTAAAFGVRQIVTTRPDADLFFGKTIDASRGTVFGVRWFVGGSPKEVIAQLKRAGFAIVATSPRGRAMPLSRLPVGPMAVVVGNETCGVSQGFVDGADAVVQIPMARDIDSLNVGVAAGISLYETRIRMVLSMLTQRIRATLGRELNVTGRLVKMALDAAVKSSVGLSGEQVVFLMVLGCDRETTMQQAAMDLAAFGDQFDAILDPLVERGFVRLAAGDAGTEIVITAAGEEFLARAWNEIENAENDAFAGFSGDERARFFNFVKRIQGNCQKSIESARSLRED